jgi:hypothetical protein
LAPVLITGLLFPGADPLVPVLLSLSVAPLGALTLLAGAIMWVAGRLQR